MREYCEICREKVEAKVEKKKEVYAICGEDIEVTADVLVCPNCGTELFCEELDNDTLLKAYNEYRRRHKLLTPKEIKGIREMYGLSQRSFASLLNWGDKTIRRYENGAVQDKAHNSLLLFLKDPANMREYLMENEVGLDDVQKAKLLSVVDSLEMGLGDKFVKRFFEAAPSIYNGFKSFSYEKFSAMVLYFAKRIKNLCKVKLLKLLNYADMIFYKENGVSISGAKYVHLPYGPVPDKYGTLFDLFESDGTVHLEIEYNDNYESHMIIPDRSLRAEELSPKELAVLDRVKSKFENFGSKEISEYSHREKGYMETQQGEFISYEYAKFLNI